MKNSLFTLFACIATTCYAQTNEPAVRIHMAAFLGTGITGDAEEMQGGALMANFAVPIELRKQWYIIPEVYGGAFRSPKYPDKVGFIFKSYPRIRHQAYGLLLGKGFNTESPKLKFQTLVGADLLLIYEPCCLKYSKFSETYDHKLYRTYSIPAQLEARFQLGNRGTTSLNFIGRCDINRYRTFGSLNIGIDVRLLSF